MPKKIAPTHQCHSFGAVLEEFEVKDAINMALASKTERYY
jgi:hypothetical protein